MMTSNESMTAGSSPGDAPACGVSVRDVSVRDRLTWITDRVETVRELIEPDSPYCPDDLLYILGVVEEFADLLRVHFAGVES
jgi:hypothetical protein